MIEGIIKKIMTTGINKYAKKYNIESKHVQIKVTNNPEGDVFYEICVAFISQELVSFLNIMDKKIDFLGYENLSSPYMKKSLQECAKENDVELKDVCCYILQYRDKFEKEQIGLAFYNNNQKLKTVSLAKHLETLGIQL